MGARRRFGELLKEGIQITAAKKHQMIGAVDQEIADALGYTVSTVQSWKQGRSMPDPKVVEFLVRYCVENFPSAQSWTRSMLIQTNFPNREELLQEIFPLLRSKVPRVYRNLPPLFGHFLGREEELARIFEGLDKRWPLVFIEGMGGVGKTTLAIKAAEHSLTGSNNKLKQPFEALVWVDWPKQKRRLNEVLDTIARVLDYQNIVQLHRDQKRVEINNLLQSMRVLIIIDNYDDNAELADWLKNIPEPSKALLTGRSDELGTGWVIRLHGLNEVEALQLIRLHARRLGLASVEKARDDVLLPLVNITEGNPKAITIALAYVKRGRLGLQEIIDHLCVASETVGGIFDHLFERTWSVLEDDEQKLLLLTPFFPDFIGRDAIGASIKLKGIRINKALERLVEMSLLDTDGGSMGTRIRYRSHTLTRSYARVKLVARPGFEDVARGNCVEYFMTLANRHLVREKVEASYWTTVYGSASGLLRIDMELPNLLHLLAWADESEDYQALVELMLVYAHYLGRSAYEKRIYYGQKAAFASKKLGRKLDEAIFRIDTLGWMFIMTANLQSAECEITEGLKIAKSLRGTVPSVDHLFALSHAFLSRIRVAQKKYDEAEFLLKKATDYCVPPVIEYRISLAAGHLQYEKGNYDAAVHYYKRAMGTHSDIGLEKPPIRPQYRLGLSYVAQGNYVEAEDTFQRILRDWGQSNTFGIAFAQYGLARVAAAKGEASQAQELAQAALDVVSRSGYRIHDPVKAEMEEFLHELS